MNPHNKQIIINTREPKENEFVILRSQTINGEFITSILDYIRNNTELDYEWMRDVTFLEKGMTGVRLFRKGDKNV